MLTAWWIDCNCSVLLLCLSVCFWFNSWDATSPVQSARHFRSGNRYFPGISKAERLAEKSENVREMKLFITPKSDKVQEVLYKDIRIVRSSNLLKFRCRCGRRQRNYAAWRHRVGLKKAIFCDALLPFSGFVWDFEKIILAVWKDKK